MIGHSQQLSLKSFHHHGIYGFPHSGQAKQSPTKIKFNPPMSFPESSKKNNGTASIRSNKMKWQILPKCIIVGKEPYPNPIQLHAIIARNWDTLQPNAM